MKVITSINNPLIKKYAKLHLKKYRDEDNLFIVEGKHMVEEAMKQNIIVDIFSTEKHHDTYLINDQIMKKLTDTKTPQNIVAVCKKQANHEIKGERILALDNIQDPGNVGTLIRTAKAFNWDAIIVSGVDVYNPKLIRATQGAFFSIPIIQASDISTFFNDYLVVGAVLNKSSQKYDELELKQKTMLVLGNEGNGISSGILEKLNKSVYIPIDFESLNVAQAGAILLNTYKK